MTIEDWLQKEWPVKPHEGSIKIELFQGKYIATVKYFVFDKNGRGAPLTDWASGDTAEEAFQKLWQEAISTINQLRQNNNLPVELADYAYRFLEDENRGEL